MIENILAVIIITALLLIFGATTITESYELFTSETWEERVERKRREAGL